ITGPAADTIFNSVGETMTAKGTEVTAPRNDQEWEAVENAAAALIESGNLLMMGNRAIDQGDWIKMSRAMIDSGKVALQAARAKNPDQVLASGEAINASCDSCHGRYQRK